MSEIIVEVYGTNEDFSQQDLLGTYTTLGGAVPRMGECLAIKDRPDYVGFVHHLDWQINENVTYQGVVYRHRVLVFCTTQIPDHLT